MLLLQTEYSNRYSICIFCDANHKATTTSLDLEKKEKKSQLLILTKPKYGEGILSATIHKCNVEEEENKNCSFQCTDRLISVNREKISSKNEVLQGMLQGSFSESLASCVSMENLNSISIEMLIHFIYGCTCRVFFCQDMNVYIELLYIAQMYFVPELQILAMHHLSLLLNPEDIPSFIENRTEILGQDLLCHLICSLISKPIAIQSKKKWVDHLLVSPLKEMFIDQISTGLTGLLNITSSICNCDSFRKYM